jgi:hypothetical protein
VEANEEDKEGAFISSMSWELNAYVPMPLAMAQRPCIDG